jgi:hypothetical protein
MMREYTPDSWKIVEIDSPKHGKIYKVLASWYGGFAGSNSWKLSSGIEDVKIDGDMYVLPQSSGSVYICHAGAEHVSGIMSGIYAGFSKQLEESGSGTIRMLDWQEFLETR